MLRRRRRSPTRPAGLPSGQTCRPQSLLQAVIAVEKILTTGHISPFSPPLPGRGLHRGNDRPPSPGVRAWLHPRRVVERDVRHPCPRGPQDGGEIRLIMREEGAAIVLILTYRPDACAGQGGLERTSAPDAVRGVRKAPSEASAPDTLTGCPSGWSGPCAWKRRPRRPLGR